MRRSGYKTKNKVGLNSWQKSWSIASKSKSFTEKTRWRQRNKVWIHGI